VTRSEKKTSLIIFQKEVMFAENSLDFCYVKLAIWPSGPFKTYPVFSLSNYYLVYSSGIPEGQHHIKARLALSPLIVRSAYSSLAPKTPTWFHPMDDPNLFLVSGRRGVDL